MPRLVGRPVLINRNHNLNHLAASQAADTLTAPPRLTGKRVSHFLPAFVIGLCLLLTFGFVTLLTALMTGIHLGHALARHDPLAGYQDIWPGQSITTISDYAIRTMTGSFTCYLPAASYQIGTSLTSYDMSPFDLTNPIDGKTICSSNRLEGHFRAVHITLSGSTVQEVSLFSDTLSQDSLLLFWGAPDSVTTGQTGQWIYFYWDRDTYTATAQTAGPRTPINLLILTAKA